jgi:hypothetical protein
VRKLEEPPMATTDKARREALLKWIGTTVRLRRSATKPGHPCRGVDGVLEDVRRTRALIDFGEAGRWLWQISGVLTPFSVEPMPEQLELF